MSIKPYVDMARANKDGSFPVYLIVNTGQGRFRVNTGITTCGRLVGLEFPRADANRKRKATLLGRYLADTEAVCLRIESRDGKSSSTTNAELKAAIQRDVFGVERTVAGPTLAGYIMQFAESKTASTRAIYELTARKVEAFDPKAGLSVGKEWLDAFRSSCMDAGMSINGVGKELRNIRAVFNWVRHKGLTQNYPFLDYRIVQEETVPNNISVETLRRLRNYPCESWQKPYVDFFFLSFYLAGINPVDLLQLRRDSYKDGHISFVRTKTNKQDAGTIRTVTLPVLPEAQEIIDRYPSRGEWLLGFMDCRNSYRSFARACNEALQKVGPWRKTKDKAGKLRKVEYSPICPGITLYSARYSFGSIAANDLDISERTIAMCLGHSWANNVTSRYMAGDQRKIDDAVRRVVEYFGSSGDTAAYETKEPLP